MDRLYKVVVRVAQSVFKFQGLQITVIGGEYIPAQNAAILAANHTGYMDFLFTGYYAALVEKRYPRFLAKKEVFDHKISGPLMRAMRHIPVDRNDGHSAYVSSVEYIKQGELVALFPEGTMSESFELQDFKSGAARLALETHIPIIPIAIWGSQRLFSKGKKNFGRSKIPVVINIGKPICPQGTEDELTAVLKENIQKLLDQAQENYETPEGAWWLPARLGGSAPTVKEVLENRIRKKAEKTHNKNV